MFAYIKGTLEMKLNNYVVIETGGIGYKIYMTDTSIDKIGDIGKIVKVHTYYYVREDNISLYGFLTNEELKMFELLLSVSGVGAKSAITILSCIEPSEFAIAIISNDIAKMKKVKGVGAKTAERIILELKDKLKDYNTVEIENEQENKVQKEEKILEAVSALQVLGYNRREIVHAMEKIDTEKLEVEDIIKKGLSLLGM